MDNEPKNLITIDLPEDVADGVYSNLTVLAHSRGEFVIDFARVLPGAKKAKVKARVVMNPENAKRTLAALQENILKYEAQFGKIQLPERQNSTLKLGGPFKGEA